MTSICCIIFEMQIACKFIDMFCCTIRKNECTEALLAWHANNCLNGRIFHNSRIFLQNMNISDRFRLKTAQYFWFVLKLWTGISVHGEAELRNKRWYHIHSHQHCPLSVLRLSVLQSVSVYKLYSRPPCIVLNLCFWFRPGLSQSLRFEPVTDVPPDRAARVLSACQELEKVVWNKLYLRQSVTACLGNCLPSVAFAVARERQQVSP